MRIHRRERHLFCVTQKINHSHSPFDKRMWWEINVTRRKNRSDVSACQAHHAHHEHHWPNTTETEHYMDKLSYTVQEVHSTYIYRRDQCVKTIGRTDQIKVSACQAHHSFHWPNATETECYIDKLYLMCSQFSTCIPSASVFPTRSLTPARDVISSSAT